MSIAASLQQYLEYHQIPYQLHSHAEESSLSRLGVELGVDPVQIAVPVMLRSARNATLMAIMPLSHSLDLNRITALLRREFDYLDDAGIAKWFPDVQSGAEPPLPAAYGIPAILERRLLKLPRVFFRAGTRSGLISMDTAVFEQLLNAYPKAVISNPDRASVVPEAATAAPGAAQSVAQLQACLEKANRLPAMPVMATRIIQLLSDPATSATDLADAIELDPSMAAQVLRYAGSPYFGYRGRIESVQDAITRVLGFDLVSSIALGIASARAFTVQQSGPLGLKAFWKHALYCAVVSQSLARKINRPEQINPGTAYLCGLLHNMGVLLMGHLFPTEFQLLNHRAEQHPETPLKELEKSACGLGDATTLIALGHDQIGGYLLEQWHVPEAVSACAYHHHDNQYAGAQADYVHIVQLANRLLAQRGIGDLGVSAHADAHFGASLISLTAAESVFEKVMEMCTEIDSLAEHIAA